MVDAQKSVDVGRDLIQMRRRACMMYSNDGLVGSGIEGVLPSDRA